MLFREILAVCSEIHTKHLNTLCGQNVELLNVKLAVHIVTTGLQRVEVSGEFREDVTDSLTPCCTQFMHIKSLQQHNSILNAIKKTGSTPNDK